MACLYCGFDLPVAGEMEARLIALSECVQEAGAE